MYTYLPLSVSILTRYVNEKGIVSYVNEKGKKHDTHRVKNDTHGSQKNSQIFETSPFLSFHNNSQTLQCELYLVPFTKKDEHR